MIKQTLFLLGVIFISSCAYVRTVNINDAQKHYENAVIYNLPETVLKVDVEVSKTIFTKGPYSEFAEKYLGITGVNTKDEVKYEISDIKINSYSEPDYNNYYVIESNMKNLLKNLSYNQNGTLVSINSDSKSEISAPKYETIQKQKSTLSPVLFTDLSVKRNFFEEKDTTSKSNAKHKESDKKDLNTKAEEAANFLIKLRKRKFNLMAGMPDKVPSDGKAVEVMIQEMEKLEKEYVELFVGKQSQETFKYSYSYTPSKDNNTSILAYFSTKDGIWNKEFKGAEQITIKVVADGKTKVIDSYLAKKLPTETKEIEGIVYRIPDLATVQVLKGENIYAQTKVQIAQTGTLNVISKEMLKQKAFSVEFNPEFGSLKSVKQ